MTQSRQVLESSGLPATGYLLTRSHHMRLTMRAMTIGDRIREARTAASLTQDALAKALGLSKSVITHWENGRRHPSVATVCRIADLTFTEPAWLLIDEIHGSYPQAQLLPEENQLLETYRRMSKRQRENLLKLLRITSDVRSEIESKPQPAHS